MNNKRKHNNICPCTVYDKRGDKPGYRYKNDEYAEWDFPCFAYDPMNKTSKKAAMKKAFETGIEELNRVQKEIHEELVKEKFKETVKSKMKESGSY